MDWTSSSEESASESNNSSYTDNEYSDDEHILLITSVANLRRRENMRLRPLRTKSKRAPIFKDENGKTEKNSNFWDLNTTKEVIQKCLEKDEREIKSRDPKRRVISEEKWGEGENWKEIVKEGEEREKVLLIHKESEEKIEEAMPDKMLHIMVPGTEPLESVVTTQSLPPGLHKRTFGPKEGGPIFNELLKTSIEIHDLVNEAGRNIASMISSMTVQVDKNLCEPRKLERMGIEVQEDGDNLLLEVMGIVDTGADVSCVSNEIREGLGRAPLRDALGKIIGIGGSQNNREKDKLRIITCDKEITVV